MYIRKFIACKFTNYYSLSVGFLLFFYHVLKVFNAFISSMVL